MITEILGETSVLRIWKQQHSPTSRKKTRCCLYNNFENFKLRITNDTKISNIQQLLNYNSYLF